MKNKCCYSLSKILVLLTQSLSKEIKIQLYTTLLRPVISYRAEIWPLTKHKKKTDYFRKKSPKNLLWFRKYETTGEWRVRKNKELERFFQKPSILNKIRSRSLQ